MDLMQSVGVLPLCSSMSLRALFDLSIRGQCVGMQQNLLVFILFFSM